MNAPTTHRMTIEQFHDWLDARTAALPYDEPKWELFDGIPEMRDSERWAHVRIKLAIILELRRAISAADLPFECGIDGLGVRIAPKESYVPEVVVFPRGLISDHDRIAPDPVVVVEVLSPSSMSKDLRIKAEGYARVATVRHDLVADPDGRELLHFRRDADRLLAPDRGIGAGTLRLEPPGIALDVAACFKA